ncbi:MAG: hypothetical protein AAF804_04180 [Bacteroidota bacterium]
MNKELHDRLVRFIEQKMNQGKSEDWVNGDFEQLSNQVRRETKVYLSTATLKRIFGKVQVNEGYTPHRSTIDALKQFADYDEQTKLEGIRNQQRRQKLIWLGLGLTAASMVFLLAFFWPADVVSTPEINGKIELERLEGTCPSTAFFNLEIDSIPGYLLDFGDESPHRHLHPSKDAEVFHFYAYPGLFEPVLRYGKEIISEAKPVLVATNGWQAFSHRFKVEDPTDLRYYPLKVSESLEDGVFHPSKTQLAMMGLDTTEILVVRLDNYSHLGVSADNFVHQSKLKNGDFWPGVRCYSIIILIQGTMGKVEFKLVAEGCSGYAKVTLADSTLKLHADLLPLALGVENWNTFEVVNTQGQVTLKANEDVLFSGSYSGTLGDLVGTSVIFHGSGSVDYVKLSAEGNEILSTPF